MRFLVKDIYVEAPPSDAVNAVLCRPCGYYSSGHRTLLYQIVAPSEDECVAVSVPIGAGCGVSVDPAPVRAIEELATLKAQLKAVLAAVEAEEVLGGDRAPETDEEIDYVTGKLTEALDDLTARRTGLEH